MTADFDSLPFDAETMLSRLKPWVECESPTFDTAAVNRMMDLASFDLAILGAEIQRIPGRLGLGDSVLAQLPHRRRGEPGILVMGHMDTVHPVGTLEALPWHREGAVCYGPGIADMKGGNMVALEALRMLQQERVETALPVSVLFTGDEEIGSPGTFRLIESIAGRHRYVLVPEPARPDGTITLGRLEILRFRLTAHGRPSHAGYVPEQGRSAIRAMAEKIIAVEQLSDARANYSVGIVNGGQWSNCVPTVCQAEVLVLVKQPGFAPEAVAALQAFDDEDHAVRIEVTPGPARPLWSPSAADIALYEQASVLAEQLGFSLPRNVSGGGSDGNFTGALGVPTLDGLGPRGQMHHTLREHIFVDSLVERARLMAGLLATLA